MNGLAVFPVVALGVGLVGTLGVQAKGQDSPAPATAQTTLTFAGQWKTSYGALTFTLEGGELRATYPSYQGTLRGRMLGHRFEGTYSDVSGEGAVRFVLSWDGRAFFGSWISRNGQGGLWNGYRASASTPDAVTTITPPAFSRCTGSFAGRWETTYGPLKIEVTGASVSGSYPAYNGTLRGTLAGDTLTGEYSDVSGSGSVRLVISPDRRMWSGTWTAASGGVSGSWNARCRG
jgi:hypothetical protein